MTSTDIAQRDEYLDQKLRTAARIVWLAMTDPLISASESLEPSAQWIAGEAEQMRVLLFSRSEEPGRYWDLRRYILRLLGISQAYASSSRAAEQVSDAGPAVSNPIREWVYDARMAQ